MQLLSACPACSSALPADPQAIPAVAGVSADASHVIFESQEPLSAETAGCTPILFGTACPTQLYEWASGDAALRGVGAAERADGVRGGAACGLRARSELPSRAWRER